MIACKPGEFKLVLGLSVGSNFWQGEDCEHTSTSNPS